MTGYPGAMHPHPALARRGAVFALLIFAVSACDRFDDTPREVASAFWSALASRDLAAAGALSDAAGADALLALRDELPLRDLGFGQILRNDSTALVETRGRSVSRDADLTFNTHLTRRDGSWRVDVRATHRELRRTALAVSFEEVQEAINESADLIVEEFEKRALEASEALREALEDLQRSLAGEPPST